ncbi:MAG: GspE/PulE family protein [Acidobacteriota bacterium]
MQGLITALHGLTALVVIAGGVSFVQLFRPDGLGEVWTALVAFVPTAAGHPVVWVSAAGWMLATVAARWLDRPTFAAPSVGGAVHRAQSVDDAPKPAEVPQGLAAPAEPVRRERERDRRRLKLEALLRGDPQVPNFVDELLTAAVLAGASDIHIEPFETDSRVSFRVRGALETIAHISATSHKPVLRRVEVLAGMPPYRPGTPQDGQLTVDTPHGRSQIRVSVAPTRHGDKLVLRLAGDATFRELGDLGLEDDDRALLESLLTRPQGLVLLTGPTGSGKTTTLYSALAHIHRERGSVSLAAIEDPIEVDLPFVQQTQVDRGRGLDFQQGLRALLRQDPDVLMIGEIRDAETAKVAVQAGLSGHLVLSSLHAESTLGIFPRLIDFGIEPFLAASATLGAVSQRLLPRLCPECRRPRAVDRAAAKAVKARGRTLPEQEFFVAEGCRACDYTGTAGRRAVFEVLEVNPDLRRAIAARATPAELADLAGGGSLWTSGLAAAGRGEVSLDALLRGVP